MLANVLRRKAALNLSGLAVSRLAVLQRYTPGRTLSTFQPTLQQYGSRSGGRNTDRYNDRGSRDSQEVVASEPCDTIYLNNVPFEATEDDLNNVLAQFGKNLGMHIPTQDDGSNLGKAFVRYESKEAAAEVLKALAENPIELGQRELQSSYARRSLVTVQSPTTTIFISKIPFSMDADDLRAALSKYESGIYSARISYKRDGTSRGIGFVDLSSVEVAKQIMEDHENNPISVQGRELHMNFTEPSYTPSSTDGQREGTTFRREHPPSNTVWAGNFPVGVTESELRSAFEPFGPIQEVRLAYFKDGRSRGFAHIAFESQANAEKLVEDVKTNPLSIAGQSVRVNWAAPQITTTNPPHSTLYIQGVQGDEDSVRTYMGDFARNIKGITIFRNQRSDSNSVAAFVDFPSVEQASEALAALNDREVAIGVRLRISYARGPRVARQGGGGVGGRDNGGGSYGYGRRDSEGERFKSTRPSYRDDWKSGGGGGGRDGGRDGERERRPYQSDRGDRGGASRSRGGAPWIARGRQTGRDEE